MRKEVIYAVIAGITIGLIAAFGVWRLSKLIYKKQPTITKQQAPNPKNNLDIVIDSFSDFDVLTQNTNTIKGVSNPNSDVIISTDEDDYDTKANAQGEFEKEIDIPSGASVIKVASFNNSSNKTESQIFLIVDSDLENNSTSYVGTITDISSKNIQIKGKSSGILQISTDDDTKFVNGLKKNAVVKETDLAIGDYVIAMGNVNGNKVLKTKKVLVTSPLPENKIEVIKGTIESISKTKLTLNKYDGETEEFTLPKKWNGPNVSELESGQIVFIVGTRDDKNYSLRSIFTAVE